MAKIYNFNKVKNLRQMNIFYKSVLNVFESEILIKVYFYITDVLRKIKLFTILVAMFI